MANTLLTTDKLVLDGEIIVGDSMVMANLVNRNHEQQFVGGIGEAIRIKGIPDMGAASTLAAEGSTSASNLTQTKVDLDIEKHFYKRITLTAEQERFDVMQFSAEVLQPALVSVTESVEKYLVRKTSAGFASQLTGTAGTAPSTIQDIVLGTKKIFDNRAPMNPLVGVIGSTAKASFQQLTQFQSVDFGQGSVDAFRRGELADILGVNWFASQNVGTVDYDDTAGTVLLNGAGAVGDTTVSMDAFTAATGTIYAGTRFTIAGTATVYTVTKDTAIASNAAADIPITPALTAIEADNDAITFKTAQTEDMIYNPRGVAAAVIAPAPLKGADSSIISVNGYSVRISIDGSISTTGNDLLVDTFAGCRVVSDKFGTVFQA